MNINLIGMRGVGKSNVARRLSALTKRPVMSTDVLFQYERGCTIAEFIEGDGTWAEFRDAEFEILNKLSVLDEVIIDCGGGIIVDLDESGNEVFSERKVSLLKQNGPIVWLRDDIARLAAKVADDPTRPSLASAHSIEEGMRLREPLYARAADFEVFVVKGERQAAAETIALQFGLLELPDLPLGP